MKNIFNVTGIALLLALLSCSRHDTNSNTAAAAAETQSAGQENVSDDVSQPNVVKVAVGSPDHTTLVKALQAAELVTSLANNGPFTVFAPTNAAFEELSAGTLDDLLKPEKKSDLANILQHHVTLSALKTETFSDGQILGMVDGTNATIHIKDGKYFIDEAAIVASVSASNGMVHIVDKIVLPPSK